MGKGLNRVMLLGNLGADPELRHTQNGTAVLNLRLATADSYKDDSGQWQERTEWHSVTVWGKRGEALAKFLVKGSSCLVEGSLRTTSYEAKDGSGKRYKTEINAREVYLTGGRQGSSQTYDPPAAALAPGGGQRQPVDQFADDDDIPF